MSSAVLVSTTPWGEGTLLSSNAVGRGPKESKEYKERRDVMAPQQVWFITGTSTGLGRALAEAVVARGEKVVATVRTPGVNQNLVEQAPDRVRSVLLDVTQPAQIDAAVQRAQAEFGRIDVLVNNAGYGLLGG